MEIERGTYVNALTASGALIEMRALGSPTQGMDFPIVWLVTNAAFDAGDEANAVPWPLESVSVRESPPIAV